MRLLASLGARERCRTLVAQDGAVWIWPGIHFTLRRGGEIVPVAGETIRFWVTRLHGPEALYKDLLSGVSRAAWCLTTDNEAKAQHALDGIGLVTLSHDGAALMKAVSRELGVAALNLPVRDGPRTWNAQDIAQHLPVFEDSVGASRILAKGVVPVFDEAKHPRWPSGAPDSQGGQFAPADEAGAPVIPVTSRGIGDNGGPPLEDPPEIPKDEPPPHERVNIVKAIAQWLAAATAAGAYDLIDRLTSNLQTADWTGYQLHHFVEQTPAEQDGFPRSQIDEDENLVYVPTLKHREISAWYQKQNPNYDGLSPRDYLRGKNWKD